MGYKCTFLDNEIYGADDVSKAFSNLLTSGVLPYAERETVAQSLNAMTQEVISDGVTGYDGMEVTWKNGIITIGSGTAYFDSGVAVMVDSDGCTLECGENEEGYVYFLYTEELNLVAPKFTAALPEGDVIPLAKIDADGTVTDMRKYAMSKIMLNTKNSYIDFHIVNNWFGKPEATHGRNRFVLPMPHNGFKYLLIRSAKCDATPNKFFARKQVLDLEESDYFETYLNEAQVETYLRIQKNGTEIVVEAIRQDDYMPQEYDFTLA
ncbi:MAG: hypothetical protein Q4B31_02855 [Clostridia bacterium]|nr:hypothetical protein [Clostridia bacterium]